MEYTYGVVDKNIIIHYNIVRGRDLSLFLIFISIYFI